MRQSARIVKQALEGMPQGAWQADAPKIVLPDREKMKTQMEALIYHFKIVTEGFRVPEGGGRPTDPSWNERRLVRLSTLTLERLEQLAEKARASPMQVAALLLEQAVQSAAGQE